MSSKYHVLKLSENETGGKLVFYQILETVSFQYVQNNYTKREIPNYTRTSYEILLLDKS